VIKLEAGDWLQVRNDGRESKATGRKSPMQGFPSFFTSHHLE
jgi:hypothetical protein